MGSSFHREGAAYLKERFVIFKEERVGGQARVTIDFLEEGSDVAIKRRFDAVTLTFDTN